MNCLLVLIDKYFKKVCFYKTEIISFIELNDTGKNTLQK